MKCKSYRAASSLEEALRLYHEDPSGTIVAAGATDLMVKARKKDWYENLNLLDISRINELKKIERTDNMLIIGALTCISDILTSETVKQYVPILTQACSVFGVPQIRNRATIGGNLANACLAADCLPALCIMRAEAVVGAWGHTDRMVPVEKLVKPCRACLNHQEMSPRSCYYGNPVGSKNTLVPGEIITEIRIPIGSIPERVYFQKVGRKAVGCMSKFTIAAAASMDGDVVKDLRLCIGATLMEIKLQEKYCGEIIGTCPSEEVLEKVGNQIAEDILNQGKTADDNIKYKAEVCRRLSKRVLLRLIRGDIGNDGDQF